MAADSKHNETVAMIKIVYFDEETASDYLDISAGGKTASSSEDVKERTKETHAKVESGIVAKLSWLPFLGASGELSAGAGAAAAGKSILSKTLSNTILTDYLAKANDDDRVVKLRDLEVTAPKDSMAFAKMFAPYMVMLRMDDIPIDLARMDEVLVGAKGYYELLGESLDGIKRVLRFNIKAFRNNYGLTDLSRMQLVFHGVLVGQTSKHTLSMEAEMSGSTGGTTTVTGIELYHGIDAQDGDLLDVYDIVLAGVEHAG
jgi:uncharacterized protein DUF6414